MSAQQRGIHKGPKRPDVSTAAAALRMAALWEQPENPLLERRDTLPCTQPMRHDHHGGFLQVYLFLSYVFECFVFMYLYIPCVCLVTMEAGRAFGTEIMHGWL